jgi:hypothetical protein
LRARPRDGIPPVATLAGRLQAARSCTGLRAIAPDAALLFIHDAPEPVLIVNDLKTPDRTGGVALWIGPESVGYFRNLRIRVGAEGTGVLNGIPFPR